MQNTSDQQSRSTSKAQLVEQINGCLQAGSYSRALELVRGAATNLPNDSDLAELEKSAQDGIQRNAEAQRLITESQELFAQQKPAEAIQLLRKAHELDEKNSLARSILANALVEHAQSYVESNWLEAEKLANQALRLNPAHPTAKTIFNRIVERKQNCSVEEWVAQAEKLQSSGDLFAAVAWIAEGLAVHPDDPKLQQVQDAIQRDQAARRRQTRRRDMEDLRHMEREVRGAADVAAKQALAERIQAVVARYWTDGEILAIANALLLKLGLEGSTVTTHGKGAPVIFHVPRAGGAKPANADAGQIPSAKVVPNQVPPSVAPVVQVPPTHVASAQVVTVQVPPKEAEQSTAPSADVSAATAPAVEVPVSKVPVKVQNGRVPLRQLRPRSARLGKISEAPSEAGLMSLQADGASVLEDSVPASPVAAPSFGAKQPEPSSSRPLVLISAVAAVIVLVAAIFFFAGRHQAPAVAGNPARNISVAAPAASSGAAPVVSVPAASGPSVPAADASASTATAPEEVSREAPPAPVPSSARESSGTDSAKLARQNQLLPVAHVRKGEEIRVAASGQPSAQPRSQPQPPPQPRAQPQPRVQPQPRLASLTIQGGAPGTTVLVDQNPVGTVQADGTLSVATIAPGDHTVELRKERFKPREFKKRFAAGEEVSLVDAALEAGPSELKINFTPADANVVIVKGTFMTFVKSGVPLNVAAGTYTLTARTAERFTRTSTFEVASGQSKTLDLALAPNGMSKWDAPGAWKQEKDGFLRKGGDFVLYGVAPAAGTFTFSAMPAKGRVLQWVLNYTDPKNYVLCQLDDENFYRAVVRNGQKANEIKVAEKGDKKSFRTLRIRVSAAEIVQQIQHGDSWTVVDRWAQPGGNLGAGKFGFYIPGNDEVAVSGFAHYADLNIR